MSQYANLKAAIAANVYENHNNQVTANMVKAAMNAMVDSLGAGYQYMGIATPATNPGTPDQRVFYIAAQPGTYTNFSGLVVNDGEVAVLKWDTAWHKEVTGAATAAQVTELGQKVLGISTEIINYTIKDYALRLDGTFGAVTTTKHAVLPVTPGDIYFLYGSLDTCRYAFATSTSSQAGGAIPLVSGTSVIPMSNVGSLYKITIPSGCSYLLFNVGETFGTKCFQYYNKIKDATDDYTDQVPELDSDNLISSGGVATEFAGIKPTIERIDKKNEQIEQTDINISDIEEKVVLKTSADETLFSASVDNTTDGVDEIILTDDDDNPIAKFTKDGFWINNIPFTDGSQRYQLPFDLHYGNNGVMVQWTTPFAIQTKHNFRKLLIWGWTDSSGNYGVSSYNPRTKEIKRTIIGATASQDMHNSPAMFELADGKIGVISCRGHNNYEKIFVSISAEVGSIDSFESAIEVGGWNGYTSYSQIHYIGGVYYVFVRTFSYGGSGDWQWQMSTSTDFRTWTTPKNIILANTTQYYGRFVKVLGEPNILRIAMYSNPTFLETDIRLGYLDVSTGNIYNGSVAPENIVGTWDDAPEYTDFSVLIQKPSNGNQRLFDIAVTDMNNVSITFSRWSDAYDSAYYLYLNGVITKICDGGEAYLHARAQLGARLVDSTNIAVARNDIVEHVDYAEIYRIVDGSPVRLCSIDSVDNGDDHFRIHMPMLDEEHQYLFYTKGLFDTTDYTIFDSDIVFAKLFNKN